MEWHVNVSWVEILIHVHFETKSGQHIWQDAKHIRKRRHLSDYCHFRIHSDEKTSRENGSMRDRSFPGPEESANVGRRERSFCEALQNTIKQRVQGIYMEAVYP